MDYHIVYFWRMLKMIKLLNDGNIGGVSSGRFVDMYGEPYKQKPEGRYTAVVIDCYFRPVDGQDRPKLYMILSIRDNGEFFNNKIYWSININDKNQKNRSKNLQFISMIQSVFDVEIDYDEHELTHRKGYFKWTFNNSVLCKILDKKVFVFLKTNVSQQTGVSYNFVDSIESFSLNPSSDSSRSISEDIPF